MHKLGSALGATRGGNKDAINNNGSGGRSRGYGATGSKIQSNRGTARGRGRNQTRLGRATANENESVMRNPTSNSPFAAIKNDSSSGFQSAVAPSLGGSQTSGFGRPSPTPGSITSNGFGAPSIAHQPIGNSIQVGRDPRSKTASQRRLPKEQLTEMNSADGTATVDYQERYEKLKLDRVKKREMAIKQGQMADPNQPILLNKAITPVGTCTTMCPEFERVERIVQKMVDKSEKSLDSATGSFEVRELKMLKRFRRSAAGYDEQLPSDIRTPNTLLQTMNYLIRHVISGPEPLGLIHKFVWDRTRSIRNDFSVQQLTNIEDIKIAVKCLERIARFHIVSLHLLSSPDNEEQFDHHQEREQLNNTMLSLMHYYDDNRDRIEFPNEPEFRAYYIVLAIHDQRPDIEDRVQNWPEEILRNSKVNVGLELLAATNNYWEYQIALDEMRPTAISQGFYNRFFNLINSSSVSYLMGCVAEIYFNNVRQTAIRSIWKAYCRVPISQQHKNEEWTLDELTRVLYFDDESQTEEFCEEQGLQLMERDDGSLYLNWGTSSIDTVDFAPSSQHSFSERYVEAKRGGRTLAAIILGMNIKQAATRGMIDTSLLPDVDYDVPIEEDEDNELFVRQDDNPSYQETTATLFQPPPATLPQQPVISDTSTLVTSNGLFGAFSSPVESVEAPSLAPNVSPWNAPAKPLFAPSSLPTTSSTASASKPLWPSSAQTSASVFAPSPLSQSNIPANTSKPLFSWPAPSQSSPSIPPAVSTTTAPMERPKPSFSWPPTSQSSTAAEVSKPAIESKPFSFAPSAPSDQKPVLEPSSSKTSIDTSKPLFSWPSSSQVSNVNFKAPNVPANTVNTESPPNIPPSTFSFQSSAPNVHVPNTSDRPSELVFSKYQPAENTSVSFTTTAPAVSSENSNSIFPRQAEQSIFATEIKDPSIPQTQNSIQEPPLSAPQWGFDTKSVANGVKETLADVQTVDQLEQDQSLEESNAESLLSSIPPVSESEISANESTDFRNSWIETLRQSAMNNRASQVTRKRQLESDVEEILQSQKDREEVESVEKSEAQLQQEVEVPKPKRAPRKQKKTSLALASIAPLPTLPILEQVKKLTQVRQPLDDETVSSRTSQVDEDEMLLSAARIAAEQLKNGPRLLERVPDYSYSDPLRSSTYLSKSLNSESHALSSSSPYARINGYDVALAPDTAFGLGHSLSRTEQRLRLTGGKGLAYKPLQLPSEKSVSEKDFDFSSDF